MNRFIYVPVIALAILLLNYRPVHAAGTCDAVTEIPTTECQALTNLYNTTNGPNWTNKSNWLVTDTPCSWYGVTCANGHVTALELPGNKLQNSLPNELGNFTQLTRLNLANNQLNGAIPTIIGNLSKLTYIDLNSNRLTGSIPPELGNLNNLVYVSYRYNHLTGTIPPELSNLVKLTTLDLSINALTGTIPAKLGNLTQLQTLNLHSNYFLGGIIPSELGQLVNLQKLYLNGNRFTGPIPAKLSQLVNLQELNLNSNRLTGAIPPQLGQLTSLITLSLSYNQVTGTIASELGDLSNLRSLDLSSNKLSNSIPPTLGNLTSLRRLILSGNQLSGSIPPELGQLTQLTKFDLSGNQLSGSIPPELGNLIQLTELQLNNNQLSGEIPLAITKLTHLYTYQPGLYGNKLIATNNQVIAFLKSHSSLYGQTVPPTNIVPTLLKNGLIQLNWPRTDIYSTQGYYEISYASQIDGPYTVHGIITNTTSVSYQVTNIATNTYIYFKIRTFVPASGSQQNSLWSDDSAPILFIPTPLFSCNLVSEIPPTECQALVSLYNKTQGENWTTKPGWLTSNIPCRWYGVTCQNGHVTSIVLRKNNLIGTIPSEIGNLRSLTTLSLGSNQLWGTIPSEIGNLTQLTTLYLHSNQLEGEIPSTIIKLTALKNPWYESHWYDSYFGYNKLTSTHPQVIAFLSSKNIYSLQTQTIPPTDLQFLNSSYGTVLVSWTPIAYRDGIGYYEISSATSPNGPYQILGQTASKTTSSYKITVVSGTTYYFKVRTFTAKHDYQLNELWSDYSSVLTVTPTSPFNCYSITEIPTTECQALTTLYTNTNGPSWVNNKDWLVTTTPCGWLGVTCANGHVVELSLGGNLSGAIPPQLGQLSQLTKLYLVGNFSGTIPPELGQLSQLTTLYLGGNLSGTIPPELGQLSQLTTLYLGGNLSGAIPPELGQLTQIITLSLNGNLSGAIPPELGQLSQLTSLDLQYNDLSGAIPPQLGQLTQLTSLNLYYNQLSGAIPPQLGQLTQLTRLDLGSNQLSGAIPPQLGQLTQLTTLYLRSNRLNGAIPPQLGQLTQLTSLDLSDNQLSGEIPHSIIQLIKSYSIYLHYNKLLSTDNEVINFLKNKSYDDWQNSQIMPPTQIQATAVTSTTLRLSWKPVGYQGSSSFYSSGSYHEISYAINETGPYQVITKSNIPQDYLYISPTQIITHLTPNQTYYFKLRNHIIPDFYGSHSPYWSDYSEVISITLHTNSSLCDKVSEIPRRECQALIALYDSTNGYNWYRDVDGYGYYDGNLQGTWLARETPCKWAGVGCTNGHVAHLMLDGYQLKGPIPAQISDLSYLTSLVLIGNQLTGTIPSELGSLTSLTFLILSDNQLSGEIPAELGKLTQLNYLSLSSNQLSGEIPAELGNLTQLNNLYLSGNQLRGEIPATITKLNPFIQAGFSHNKLTTTNNEVMAFLERIDNAWFYQTVSPSNITATRLTTGTIQLSWTPIALAVEAGYYEISYATQVDGPYSVNAVVSNTASASYQVTPIATNTTYYFKLRTFTPANNDYYYENFYSYSQQNDLWSDYSEVITVPITIPAKTCYDVTQIPVAECKALINIYTQTQGINWSNSTHWLNMANPCNWVGVGCESGHVTQLNLAHQNLQGALPTEITTLTYLTSLDLNHNQLSGIIPPELGQLKQLKALTLTNNLFSGSIPATLSQLNQLTYLNLSTNHFSGTIPVSLTHLTALQYLNLAHNHLNGTIPIEMGQLTNLKTLMLNDNQLEGEIPTALLFLGLLQSLDISYNKFTATTLGITTWLNKLNPSWAQTQTTPPLNLQVTLMPTGTIRLTWQPISYTTDNGYYEISYTTAITSNYIVHGFTTNKSVSSYEFTNLKGDNRYYFRIRSYTPAHDKQQNELWSDYSVITFKNTRNIYLPIVQQNEKSTR